MSEIPVEIKNLLKKYTPEEINYMIKKSHEMIIRRRSMKIPIYTKEKVENIIKKYDKKQDKTLKKKTLVICHGKKHKKKFKNALLLNRSDIAKPDIISNAWSDEAMGYLPKEYFDIIIMEYCPLGNPFSTKNKILWKNLYRILKKGGKIENSSILGLYGINVKEKSYDEMNDTEKSIVENEVEKHIKKLKFKNIKHLNNPNENEDKITIIFK